MPPVGTLPAPLNPLIGRERELADLTRLLAAQRLVTITGPGGVGKTHLAVQTATLVGAQFPGVTIFVPLATVDDSALVLPTIARFLNIGDRIGVPLLDHLTERLAERPCLLLLDNLEQLVSAAPDVAALLAALPQLQVLATSRAPLRIGGEQEFPLAPLAVPAATDRLPPSELTRFPAVQLFVERARAILPQFTLSDQNSAAVAAICARLDGLPLALELAAPRLRSLEPDALLARLDRRLPLLIGGRRDAPERQRTLRATLQWSYDLLPPKAQSLFRQLGVFQGGFTPEAAAAISASPEAVFEQLDALVEQSLVYRVPELPDRLALLETVRELSVALLAADPLEPAVHSRHAAYFAALAERAAVALVGPEQGAWYSLLDAERANLHAALSWALRAGDLDAALRIVGGMWRYWWLRNDLYVGRQFAERAIAAARGDPALETSRAFAAALRTAAGLAWAQDDYAAAEALHAESLPIWRALAEPGGIADALHGLAMVAVQGHDDDERAYALYNEALVYRRQVHDPANLSRTINNLGALAERRGDLETALARYREAEQIARSGNDTVGLAFALAHAGEVLAQLGRYSAARPLIDEALELSRRTGLGFVQLEALQCAAELAGHAGDAERSIRLFAAVERLRRQAGTALAINEYPRVVALLKADRVALGAARFAALWAEGQHLDLSAATQLALSTERLLPAPAEALLLTTPERPLPTTPTGEQLTPREREVLQLLAQGLSNAAIGEQLFLSVNTVQTHVRSILAKLDVPNRSAATRYALEHGLV